jgi:hypothetical protein
MDGTMSSSSNQVRVNNQPPNPMRRLYQRLEQAKLDSKYVSKVALPEWWDDSIAESEAGYARALGFLATYLGIDLKTLWNDSAPLGCMDFGKTNFKKSQGVSEADVQWPKCVALSAARIALQAMNSDFMDLPTTGAEVRDEILRLGKSWVDLESLLDFLWARGVPVLHVSEFPSHAKKMQGLAAKVDGRPVIVISKKHPFSALVLFDIAHELGHILCKHVDQNSIVLDSAIDRVSDTNNDPEETAANNSAVETLTGMPDRRFTASVSYVNARALAVMATHAGREHRVDPGVVAQNFGHGRQSYALSNGACKIIEPDAKPIDLVRSKMVSNLNLDELSLEDGEFLFRVTGAGAVNGIALGQ